MTIAAITTMTLLVGLPLYARDAKHTGDSTVTVCMNYDRGVASENAARLIASRMFRRVGVTLSWMTSGACPPLAIRIDLARNTPKTFQAGALAYAMPYEGTNIRVFYDRIDNHGPEFVPRLLAHVLVHEITHVLQGLPRHSTDGVMKAHWDKSDTSRMLSADLPFNSEDVTWIRLGLARRARPAQMLAALNAAP